MKRHLKMIKLHLSNLQEEFIISNDLHMIKITKKEEGGKKKRKKKNNYSNFIKQN